MFSLLIGSFIKYVNNVKALKKHKLTSTYSNQVSFTSTAVTRNAFIKEYQISSKRGVQVAKQFCKLKLNQLKNFSYVKQTKNNSFFSVNKKNDFFA